MIKELNLSRADIEESLKKILYNNHMATYLLLARTGGPYNNRVPEVLNQSCRTTTRTKTVQISINQNKKERRTKKGTLLFHKFNHT